MAFGEQFVHILYQCYEIRKADGVSLLPQPKHPCGFYLSNTHIAQTSWLPLHQGNQSYPESSARALLNPLWHDVFLWLSCDWAVTGGCSQCHWPGCTGSYRWTLLLDTRFVMEHFQEYFQEYFQEHEQMKHCGFTVNVGSWGNETKIQWVSVLPILYVTAVWLLNSSALHSRA